MHYEPEPDACRALFVHLKTHAQATMQGLTASELEQAQVSERQSINGKLRVTEKLNVIESLNRVDERPSVNQAQRSSDWDRASQRLRVHK